MLDKIVYACGQITIILLISFATLIIVSYVKSVLKKQRKIKCLCHHEYEPYSAFYFGGVEYEFKCRKCGKIISVQTVTDDNFDWAKNSVKYEQTNT
jgi:hypothetical protein